MKIVMALAGLDIGGAETHVVELSKEIKRRGHDVVMISGGGVYQKEVEDFGIKHYLVPIKQRNYADIIKSKKIIRKILEDEKPDIVHAHARIPGFILGRLHKEMGKPFVYVTTAHWTFDTSFMVRTLTCWGEKTLAVSEDIKKYLLKYYDVDERNIFISINGIDTNKFSRSVSGDRIMKEFNLTPGAKRIVYVSRLNPLVCAPAFKIIEKIDKINEKVPGIEVVIVGDGDAYPQMKAEADMANERLGRRAVILAGARTDINEIHATADVCVGVSRAILEPMAMEKKCVIAGQEGYIGILSEDNLQQAIDCNFTCRGCDDLDAERLSDDIIKLFETDDAKKITDYGKYVVDTYYSIKKMADDNMAMYRAALRDCRHDAVMLGYYGYGNCGDDALLGAILDDFRKRSDTFSPVVLSHEPEVTSRDYGVSSINRFNIFKMRRAMERAKLFIAGGGSLIQDVTSTKSLIYYLYCIRLAKKKGLKVMLYANGIGPVNKEGNRKKVAEILNLADAITLRDKDSAELLKTLGVTKPQITVTADPAFGLEKPDETAAKKLLKELGVNGDFVCVSVRDSCGGEKFAEGFAKMIDHICQTYGVTALFIPMQYEKDGAVSREVISKMKTDGIIAGRALSVEETMGVISLCRAAVAVRLHMLIFGAALGVPVLGIDYDPKVKSFIDAMGLDFCLKPYDVENGSYERLTDKFMNEGDSIRQKTQSAARRFKEKAAENARIALELIGEKDGRTGI